MLVVGGVEDAGREEDDVRIGRGGVGRDRFQRCEEFVGIVFDRRYAMAREQFGEKPQHDFAVFQHVGDARGRARVVFEYVKRFGVDPYDVDAGDVHVYVMRYFLAVHLRTEDRILKHHVIGDDPRFKDFAAGVDVLQIQIDRLDALFEAAVHEVPLGRRKNARDHVEGDQALLRFGFAIDGKRDADAAEQQFRFLPAIGEHIGRHTGEPGG